MTDRNKTDALTAVRARAGAFADDARRLDVSHQRYIAALRRAEGAGAEKEEVELQVELAVKDRPEREAALNQLAKTLGGDE